MQGISGVGGARDQRAYDTRRGFSRSRYEIAASPHPAALRASTLPIKAKVAQPVADLLVRLRQIARIDHVGSFQRGLQFPIGGKTVDHSLDAIGGQRAL